jgi:hypothetical protein
MTGSVTRSSASSNGANNSHPALTPGDAQKNVRARGARIDVSIVVPPWQPVPAVSAMVSMRSAEDSPPHLPS